MPSRQETQALAQRLPDVPRWIEARAMLFWNECEVFGLRETPELSFIVRRSTEDLAVIVGRPELDTLRRALTPSPPGMTVIAPWAQASWLAAALPAPEWSLTRAILYRLGSRSRLPPLLNAPVAFVKPGSPDWRTIPEDYLEEFSTAARHSPIAATFAGGRPVSFCYAGSLTETLWDVSIDTLPEYRRRGYASLCAAYLIAHMLSQGKEPVWGAVEENLASRGLAERLGFTPVDELVLLERRA